MDVVGSWEIHQAVDEIFFRVEIRELVECGEAVVSWDYKVEALLLGLGCEVVGFAA